LGDFGTKSKWKSHQENPTNQGAKAQKDQAQRKCNAMQKGPAKPAPVPLTN
jgi:hypothetical protein